MTTVKVTSDIGKNHFPGLSEPTVVQQIGVIEWGNLQSTRSVKKLVSQKKVRHRVTLRGACWGGGRGGRLEHIDVPGKQPGEMRVSGMFLAGNNQEG